MKCPKCGSEMKDYQTQTCSRVGYETDIEIQAFRCSNPKCKYTENIKREVLSTNALYIEEKDGSMTKIR